MATLRGSSGKYNLGSLPPQLTWTVVRGDTAAFRIYVADDSKVPLVISDWDINMKIKRPNSVADLGVITDDAELIFTLSPQAEDDDLAGQFTVSLTSAQSLALETGDIFDVQLSDDTRVWTVCQGKMIILQDVTD